MCDNIISTLMSFINDDFILQSEKAKHLYHSYAKDLPIIDYHCHIPPKEIDDDKIFENLTDVWLRGDHYKWRAMRTNGIDEKFCTGNATDKEKFEKWAETIPYTLRNPLYHWSHLELKRYFDIDELVSEKNHKEIYDKASAMINSDEFSCRKLIKKMNVEVICTTDDPVDSLEHHINIRESGFETKVLPTWRPDKVVNISDSDFYNEYINKLSEESGIEINSLADLFTALKKRHEFFHEVGCRISDHGLTKSMAVDFTIDEVETLFLAIRSGDSLSEIEKEKLGYATLNYLLKLNCEKGWAQQLHIGAIRNNNSPMFEKLGPDTGFDSIADYEMAEKLNKMLNDLNSEGKLTKTIIYNLNPKDNEVIATAIGNFQDGTVPGKIQFGSGWWFLDQKDGMEKQMNALSTLGLLSRFVGMLTDSRSFLSYPRHEYFRRILCNLIGNDVEQGLIPDDDEMLKRMIQDICYYNAKRYFGF